MVGLPRRAGNDRITGEQSALRRVATLVAGGAAPADVFTAVTEEAGRLLGADYAAMGHYDAAGVRTVVASWSSTGADYPVGAQARRGEPNVSTLVFETGRAARIDDFSGASGPSADEARAFGIRAVVGVPIRVEGRLWGIMFLGSTANAPLPERTERQLAGFTELAATAIANAEARVELRGHAEEQAALRRVATLVARAAPPAEVLTAVTEEAGRLLHADHATMGRYGADGSVSAVAAWDSNGAAVPVVASAEIGAHDLHTMIFDTRQPARIDDAADISGPAAAAVRELGLRAAVGVPVSVEGRLWGLTVVESRAGPLPPDTETRLAGFTELAGTAIANAEARVALTASRARIVATADATRRRIERNLHDGAQQRLVSLALDLRAAQADAPPRTGEQLDRLAAGLDDVLNDLREIARGLHPAILADGGLAPALKTLARRSAIPVHLDIQVAGRLPEQVEIAAYYTVAEALTNAAKHASATTAEIQATADDRSLRLRIRDNGRGGADFSHGTGLLGLSDRVETLGGHLLLHSPAGAGTTVEVTLPLA
jgi:signal transduction histidine kinase